MGAADAYSASTPEVELDHRRLVSVAFHGERARIANAWLTNDRILFSQGKFAAIPSGALAAILPGRRSEGETTSAEEAFALADVRRVRRVHRALRGDVYEFTLADGVTHGLGASAAKAWDPLIRRLLRERHGRTLVEDGEAWSVQDA